MSDQDVDVDILDLDMEGASMSEGEDGETVDVDQEVDTELKGIEDIRLHVMEALKKKEERKKQKDKKKKLRKLRAEKAALERQLRELMESSGDESEEEVLSPTTVNTAKNRKKVSFAGVQGVSDISQTLYEDQSVAAQRVSGVRGAPTSEGIGIPRPTALSSFWDQGESGIVHSHQVMIVLLSVLFQVRLVWLSRRNRELQVRLGIKLKNLNYGPMWLCWGKELMVINLVSVSLIFVYLLPGNWKLWHLRKRVKQRRQAGCIY